MCSEERVMQKRLQKPDEIDCSILMEEHPALAETHNLCFRYYLELRIFPHRGREQLVTHFLESGWTPSS